MGQLQNLAISLAGFIVAQFLQVFLFRLIAPEHKLQEGIYLLNLVDDYIVRIVGECPVTDFELFYIAKPSVLRTLPDSEHAVKEIVEPFAAGKVVGRDEAVQRAFWRMRQHKDGQPVFLFEVVELYHQPSCRIALLYSAAQIGKIVIILKNIRLEKTLFWV